MVDRPGEQGSKFNLTNITYNHEDCETANVRVVRTKFRDDAMSAAERYDNLLIRDSEMEPLETREITLGTIGEINEMIEDDPEHRIVVEATLSTYAFHY